ncbi:MAG TPA: hemin uptake protein HemP [Pirellulales bacterium]|nr:hemin uptake protein HemP [Pirellulales bacterium]
MSQANEPPAPRDPSQDAASLGPGRVDRPRTLSSEDLLRGAVEVLIKHGSDVYRLRLTRSGKLILQK